jgi:glycosyltransferase involved in cell wall biosynthesis
LSFCLVSELRDAGISNLARRLLHSRYRRIVIPYEVPEALSVLSLVQLLAAAHKLPRVEVCDAAGNLRRVRLHEIVTGGLGLALASLDGMWARHRSGRGVGRALRRPRKSHHLAREAQRVLYLNNTLWFGLRTGGSIGHVAGVINGLAELGHQVRFVSPMPHEHLAPAVKANTVTLFSHFALPPAANLFRLQARAVRVAMEAAREFKPTFVYQRLSGGDWSGVQVADALGIPLVVEYNGSELWIAKNWGRKVRCAAEIQMAEEAMLRRADLVFTVSQPLCDELLARNVAPDRVAWYPNCVDPTIFNPAAIPEAVRTATRGQLGAEPDDFVFLFLGTFGLWHGAEVFARAAALVARDSEWMRRTRVRFAFVGDGKTRPQCQEIIKASLAAARTEFTGLVAQHEAPRYLAAADAFVSPHVPNADGSRFFGSPTKLFEYMAMARPIVASALDQIAEVLDHERTALLAQPGDVESLAAGLRRVVEDRTLGARLGAAARAEVLAKYTWTRHVSVMLDALARAGVIDTGKGGK